jgi:hypothetical protein
MIGEGARLGRDDRERGSLNRLLVLFLEICLLRKGPQDVPSSPFLVAVTALLGLVTGVIALRGSFGGAWQAFLAQLIDLLLLTLLVFAGLRFLGRPGRLYQALAAFFGCGVLINLATLVAMGLAPPGDGAAVEGPGAMLYLFVVIWALVVTAHIVRHTFEIAFLGGVAIAVAYSLLVNGLVQHLFQGVA